MTSSEVRRLLNYDADTGVFTRAIEKRCGKNNSVVRYRVGDVAGGMSLNGYVQIALEGKLYYAHRLAVLYMTGEWPKNDVDHIDGQRSNNRYANLRDVSRQTNAQNQRRAAVTNKSGGLLGAHKSFGKWEARIAVDSQTLRLGRFATAQEAHEVYVEAKRRLHVGCTI